MLKMLIAGLGAGLLVLWGHAFHRSQTKVETAEGEVIRLEETSGSGGTKVDFCPVFRWSAGGATVEHESSFGAALWVQIKY